MIKPDTIYGNEILELITKNPDAHDLSNYKNIKNDSIYLIKQHIGFYKPKNKSGIFITSITEMNEEYFLTSL